MEPQFWHERWELKEIGFHQPQVHPCLTGHWPGICPNPGRAFVPLCGKSLDMAWLRNQGHSVLGVELSPIAVTEFFAEQSLAATVRAVDGFQSHASDGIELLCGDFFALQPIHLGQVDAVYDRAALIALPRDLQTRYAAHLLRLLPQRPPILLIAFEYDPAEMDGPPFSTPQQTIHELFGQAYQIDLLATQEILPQNPGLQSRGLTRLTEKAYRLRTLA